LTALSGDVVLAGSAVSTRSADGQDAPVVALIDRYPAGTLTLFNPLTDAVTHQAALSPGYNGNPQDIMSLDATTVLVSRLEDAPPGATIEPSGSDLAVFRLAPTTEITASGQLVGRMDLSSLADAGFSPMPARIARVGSRIFVGLAHLTADFATAGPGRIAVVDAPSDLDTQALATWLANARVVMIEIPGLENCTELAASPDASGVWIVCSGSFRRGGQAQTARSGLAFVGADGSLEAVFRADELTAVTGEAAPLGFTLAAVDAHRAVVVALGDLVTKRGDRALLVTRPTAAAKPATVAAAVQTLHETGAHDLGDALALDGEGTILLADGNPREPQIWKVRLPSAGEASATATALALSSTTGLPPRGLKYFRHPK